jgi:8-oxo-dGTP diphosphatase
MIENRLIADPQVERPAQPERTVTEVAVGVMLRPDGAFLLTTRPKGKVYEDYWEFPGGKLEPGETAEAALQRELKEELGIVVDSATQWKTELVDYPHALVRLNFFKVTAWQGELQMREAQAFCWQQLPVKITPVLPGTVPVLQWLAQERNYSGDTHSK